MLSLVRIRPSALLALAALPLAAACTNALAADLEAERRELAEQRQKWEQAGIDSYEMTIGLSCYCGVTGPIRVRVENGQVVWRVFVDRDEPVPADYLDERDTVEEIFAYLERTLDREPDAIDITYYPERGVPREADIDPWSNAIDDESRFFVHEFTPVN